MTADDFHRILADGGFRKMGNLDCDVKAELWWHTVRRIELSVVHVGQWVLVRASKYYRLKAWGQEGELFARDLSAFEEDLTTRFGEVHMLLSVFPRVTVSLARKRMEEKRSRLAQETCSGGGVSVKTEELARDLSAAEASLKRDQELLRLDGGKSALLQRALRERMAEATRRVEELRAERRRLAEERASRAQLELEYLQKGTATLLMFVYSSNIQAADTTAEFADAVDAVVKELQDVHRYQIQQKLQGGKLQIYVEEIDSPGVSLLTHWAGGALCPTQLEKLGPDYRTLREAVERELLVFPRANILLGGAAQDEKKLVGARIVRSFLDRLEKVPAFSRKSAGSPEGKMPIWIGNAVGADGEGRPWELPLEKAQHVFVSGRTGSGKTYVARVIVEGATTSDGLAILVLDPRGQWLGLCCPEDRPDILARYGRFGMKARMARSFRFRCHCVGQELGEPLPKDRRELAKGRRIVSFKGLEDAPRCETFADVLSSVFEACSDCESVLPRVLIVMDEATCFTRRGVEKAAEAPAERAEQAIDRMMREGRKYGIQMLLIGQSSRDFSYAIATVRQNVTTRFFLANSDREIEYAADYLPDGRDIVSLRTGEAFICNPEWGVVKADIRPPFSKVWDFGRDEMSDILGGKAIPGGPLSAKAEGLLAVVHSYYQKTGTGINLTRAAGELGITSKRLMQDLVEALEKRRLVKTRKLNERGSPRIIEPA